MSTLKKMLASKKAAILADAEKRAAEVDRDMAELERLTSKYGLQIVEPPPANGRVTEVLESVANALTAITEASLSARAKTAAEAYIRVQKRPVPLAELAEVLERNGIKFPGQTPRNTLSAVLGQSTALYSISRSQGWWLKGVPIPDSEPTFLRRF
ncbi:MAG: hypothetical protein ACRECC_07340 [Pseudolabrys sp.]